MLQYRQISQLLRPHGLQVAELRSDEKMAWQLMLGNGLTVVIGRDQVLEKIKRFLAVYKTRLREKQSEIVLVDVRYNNGVAVRWRSSTADAEALASAK